jgi:hypothetical protein
MNEGFLTRNIGELTYEFLILPHPSGAAKKSHEVIEEVGMQKLLLQAKTYFG